jgi:hypothetical protein
MLASSDDPQVASWPSGSVSPASPLPAAPEPQLSHSSGWIRASHSGCWVSYGPPWAHYLGGYQDRILCGPLGLLDLCHTAPDGVGRKDYGGEVLG